MDVTTSPELSELHDLHVGIFDLDGVFRHKLVSAKKAAKLIDRGYSFCDVVHAWDSAEVQWEDDRTYIDRPATIFPETLRRWPFGSGAGVAIADFTGAYGENSPRNHLLRQLEKADAMGFGVTAAFEYEFFLLDETADTLRRKDYRDLEFFAKANRTYSLQSAAAHADLFDGLRACMQTLDIGLDSLHTELGPGCFEAPLAAATGVKAADDAALFRNFARAYFARNDLTTVFMSKLDPELSGQSGHFHISLQKDGQPVFHDPSASDGLSQIARQFIGGLLALMPELLVMTAHTVNAYKRLVPGAWAPTWSSWGVQNRTTAVRIINDSPEATRVEFRVPSADANPHATMALCLAAGLWGIETGAEPGAPLDRSAYDVLPDRDTRFPRDLVEATDRLEASETARALFGDGFVDHFVRSRRYEVQDYLRQVTDWEIRRYLELF
ncbi:glutamine synthetase family protein [Salipiger abyssi]|uniref:glutamine synthetase family protein n=1 Tax=Salipiger abyssi TaxID=1250539 RepID=UPI001A8ED53B|nr:glutamine synthetase family protein [Salipiger abyssi]MBN9888925.1 glutamine synthetase [Salipiger abyssi]